MILREGFLESKSLLFRHAHVMCFLQFESPPKKEEGNTRYLTTTPIHPSRTLAGMGSLMILFEMTQDFIKGRKCHLCAC